ncbi:MAG: rhomboid family intramembrane serine protease [Hyphomicrobiales bacterium]|nr:MAG: rhomboid family intramembrane serine protease [Hyphomicrobiales bacterium]
MNNFARQNEDASSREPVFNMPPVVVALAVLLAGIHAARMYLISADTDLEVLIRFAFIPARFGAEAAELGLPGGAGADLWMFVTYAYLHGDWVHLAVNVFWLAAFGSAVAWRFGALRFLLLSAAAAIGGAVAHLIAHPGEFVPVIGASGAVSGLMAAAARFVFFRRRVRAVGAEAWRYPAPPLLVALRDGRVLIFLAVWFGLNLLVGIGAPPIAGVEGEIAWQAHIGGFFVGLLMFSVFDPKHPEQPARRWDDVLPPM